uniref:Uncharacterized protein n=1 Tax=Oryza glaberrima TaxID=4538 RepID=I1PL11_ORYGL
MAVATNVSCQAHPLIPNPASSLSHAACAQGGKMHSISCCDRCDFSPLSRTILSPGGKVVVAVVLPEATGKGSVTREHSGLGAGHQLDLRRSDGTAGFAAATTLLDAIITFSKATSCSRRAMAPWLPLSPCPRSSALKTLIVTSPTTPAGLAKARSGVSEDTLR